MKKRAKKIILSVLIIFAVVFTIVTASELGDFHPPKTEMCDMEDIVSGGITESEYITLREQTGLSKTAVDDIMKKENYLSELSEFQAQNFADYKVSCEFMVFPFTKQESLIDKDGKSVRLKLPEIKTGDILVTLSTHTLLFRHGHAGLVTNAYEAEVLEAMMIGVNSDYGTTAVWKKFPAIAVLRPKNLSEEEIESVVGYAKEKLWDVKYDLFSGIIGKSCDKDGNILKTHCSHLVWSAYKSIGVDIDSDGGLLVLPEDFLKSTELDIVWSYGINATKYFKKY